MATFGLDPSFVTKFKKELNTDVVRTDQGTDFFLLPQLDVIYRYCGEALKKMVAEKLGKSSYGPKPSIEVEIPKSARTAAKTVSIVGPNYFRPGSVLLPEDRLIYHFLGQEAAETVEKVIDRTRVYSNVPSSKKGAGFAPSSTQWQKLKNEFAKVAKDRKYKFVLKCDISQYFSSINQHELVNQLEHQGFASELVRFSENFMSGSTTDRSSRGIVQGCYGSDVLGNGYLTAVDEYITTFGLRHFRYVDDMHIFFESSESLRDFFPKFVKKLRDYDLALNESKTFVTVPAKLLREETELDEAIKAAKKEAEEKLTDYQEIEIEGEYDDESYTEILETPPSDDEVELESTYDVFNKLNDFKGEERERAESFCLSFFRRASDPVAIPYVVRHWLRTPEKAKEYALYLNRFITEEKHRKAIDKLFVESASEMIDFQWCWAGVILRRSPKMSETLLKIVDDIQKDGSRHVVIRSLLLYSVCRHGSPQRKKDVRDSYPNAPLLVQLAMMHASRHFTSGERNALLKTAEGHGELQTLMCEAVKLEAKARAGK